MQKVISDGSELDEDWLDDRAEQEVQKSRLPNTITEITGADIPDHEIYGQVFVGDWLPVKIDYGRIQVDAFHRVEKLRLNVDGTMNITFGEVISA
jgi:hypothetical protein